MSGKTSEIDVKRGFDVGADDYIKKPFDLEKMKKTVAPSSSKQIRSFISKISESLTNKNLRFCLKLFFSVKLNTLELLLKLFKRCICAVKNRVIIDILSGF